MRALARRKTAGPWDEFIAADPGQRVARSRSARRQRYGFHACVLRLPLVYGRGIKGNLLRMIEAIDLRRFPPLPETGNRRSVVHVDEVVQNG